VQQANRRKSNPANDSILSSAMISAAARRTLTLNKATLGMSVQIRLLSSKKGENKKERLDTMPTKKNQDKVEHARKSKDGHQTKDKKGDKSNKEPQLGKSERKSARSKGKYDVDSGDER
jgi:hypothetical protein